MSESLEQRVANLEKEIAELGEIVRLFAVERVDGNLTVSISGSIDNLEVSAEDVGNDITVTAGNVGGVGIDVADVGNDLNVHTSGDRGVIIETQDIGNNLEIHAPEGRVEVGESSNQ